MSRPSRLLAAGVATVVLAPMALVVSTTGAVAATELDRTPSVAAADWLVDQVVVVGQGESAQAYFTSPYATPYDQGLAVDAIVSLDRAEIHGDVEAQLHRGLAADVESYLYLADSPDDSVTYLDAGRAAKVLLAASAAGDVTSYGDVDPQALVASSLDDQGRGVNQGGTQQGRTSVFSQTYTVEALAVTDGEGSSSTAAAAAALLDAQCDDGGFPFAFDEAECVSDVDTTARALIALDEAAAAVGDEFAAQTDSAGRWLFDQGSLDGSFDPGFGPSTSTTLLAVAALSRLSDSDNDAFARRAVRAASWVRTVQLDSVSASGALADEAGAILNDPAAVQQARPDGFSVAERASAVFTAAQSFPALALLDGTINFSDVPPGWTFDHEIRWLSQLGVTSGYDEVGGTVTYRGSQPVLREQMAAFLYRFEHEGSNPESGSPAADFTDVAASHPFTAHIAWLADEGITTGYADGAFRPGQPVLREQMAAFLYRMAGSPPVTLPQGSPFRDVPTTHVFFTEIVWLSRSGITTGYDDGSFAPSQPVRREQMAAFLYRTEYPQVTVPE